MHLKPAEYVISVFGGVRKTAKALGRSAAAVSKWKKSREEKGCGGRIPSAVLRQVLDLADVFRLDITSQDLIEGRDVLERSREPHKAVRFKNGFKYQGTTGEKKMKEKQAGEIDTEWFHYAIKSQHESLRKFALLMIGKKRKPFDVGALSLTLRGIRKMTIDEACQIAKLLDKPFLDVVRRTGADIPE